MKEGTTCPRSINSHHIGPVVSQVQLTAITTIFGFAALWQTPCVFNTKREQVPKL